MLEDQLEILVTELTTEVWRRDEQTHDLRTELSLHALHSEDVTQQQYQEYAGLHQHLTRLVQETQQYREMFEESLATQSAARPEIDGLRQREAELLREVRRHSNDSKIQCSVFSGIGQTWSPTNPGYQKACTQFASYTAKLCNGKHQLCRLISLKILIFQT